MSNSSQSNAAQINHGPCSFKLLYLKSSFLLRIHGATYLFFFESLHPRNYENNRRLENTPILQFQGMFVIGISTISIKLNHKFAIGLLYLSAAP